MKAILKRHGAFIAVDANEPQGSVFTITFPKDGSADGEKSVDAEETSVDVEDVSAKAAEDPFVDAEETPVEAAENSSVDAENPSTETAEAAETGEPVTQN